MRLKKSVKRFLLLIIFILILLIFLINNLNKKEKEFTKKTQKPTFETKCKKINYCNLDNKQRYLSYKKKNPSLKLEDIITYVNLNLDYSFYTNTKETPFLNKDYILVNKYLHLGSDYVPDNLEDLPLSFSRKGMKLVKIAKEHFVEMATQAQKDGYKIIAMSSYRSYDYQVNLYNRYVKSDSVEVADTYSARPGFSEHQTGLCIDIYDGVINYTSFENSNSFNWMKDNAHKYGFILRFPKGKEAITGYQYESWHYRYVGRKIATYIHDNDITFDEYYVRFIEPKFQK